jgi:hypothetical protein
MDRTDCRPSLGCCAALKWKLVDELRVLAHVVRYRWPLETGHVVRTDPAPITAAYIQQPCLKSDAALRRLVRIVDGGEHLTRLASYYLRI